MSDVLKVWGIFKEAEGITEGDMEVNGKKLQAHERLELMSEYHGQAVILHPVLRVQEAQDECR